MCIENDGAARAELAAIHRDSLSERLHRANAEIARLTCERDQALARAAEITSSATALAAAAAMEMRERAADELQDVSENWDCGHMESRLCDCRRDAEQWGLASDEIRALPTDPDAQKALDKLLAKAREDAIREAAHLIECDGDALGGKSGAAKAILALLNDGGQP